MPYEFAVNLRRDGPQCAWGIRLVGGNDLDTPLIITRVQMGSPAQNELLRGDVITKLEDYDARDLSHRDAQLLFKTAGNQIHVVVRRDNKIAYSHNESNSSSRCSSALPPISPVNSLNPNSLNMSLPCRAPSPLPPGPESYATAIASPINSLPHTVFPYVNESGGYNPPSSSCFSPMPTRDHQQEVESETAAIVGQPYRTTPLILPGAKVKKDALPTESYLRHHPNPAMRCAPPNDYTDVLMKQKVADTVLHRVVGEDALTGKVAHKQFNSPIGLYSDSNIETTIKQTVPYKKTVVYDPSKSETYRALQEGQFSNQPAQEMAMPVQTKVFQPNRMVPGKKPTASFPPPSPQIVYNTNNNDAETIHQSNSFKRLMYSVLGETDY